ncbi:multidrug efflux RND transporter periplasmic adaptor subunit MexV [soil metagenome]
MMALRNLSARRIPPAVLSAALVALLLVGGAWWKLKGVAQEGGAGRPEGLEGTARDFAIPVAVDSVRQGTLVLNVEGTGQAEASDRATIAAQVAGRIAVLPVEESARVGRGAALARLDAREYELGVREAEADLAEARVRYREMTLFDEQIEDPAVREERGEAARARSGLAAAEIALERARLDLTNTSVPAPFSGQVADVLITVGEYAPAGQELMTLVDIDPIHVEVQVVEGELRWLDEGSEAEVRLPAFPDTVFQGRVASINPVVDPETRTARVTLYLPNPEGRILPGMFARVSLAGRAFDDRVMVPEEALIERDDRTLVFIFEPRPDGPPGEGWAKWVYVTPGLSNGEVVELVESGETEVPAPGTLVITGGNYTLIHDARVRIVTERPP